MVKSGIRKILIILFSIIAAAAISVGATYAYFRMDYTAKGFSNVKIELLFEILTPNALKTYQQGLKGADGQPITLVGDPVQKTGDYEWGHKGNPYVIAQPRHLHNLAVLQNIGYFDKKFISQNLDASGNAVENAEYSDKFKIPYFYVSTTDGQPVVINGEKETIEPIGTDEYPFIGSLSGASGTAATLSNQKTTTTSAIQGVKVVADTSKIDYGFFGKIGYLGKEVKPAPDATTPATFKGYTSRVENLLLSDIQIVVRDTVWDHIRNFFDKHLFFGKIQGAQQDLHETGHVGIIAGHVEYAILKNISLYYTSESIMAIDLQDAGQVNGGAANYSSVTGYFGFIYNLNPSVTGVDITTDSGLEGSDVIYGSSGGGGLTSGTLPGYIRAGEMYNIYNHYADDTTQTPDPERPLYLIKAQDQDGKSLVETVKNNTSTNYFFRDGVFTFALSYGQKTNDVTTMDTIENIWETDKVDDFVLSQDGWKIGKDQSTLRYYKNLKLVTDLNTIGTKTTDANGNLVDRTYYVGAIINNLFYYMDLSTIGRSVPAKQSVAEIKETNINGEKQWVLSYKTVEARNNETKSRLKINKNGGSYNFVLNDKPTKNKLGIGKGMILGSNIIYCGNKSRDGNFLITYQINYNLNVEASAVPGAWLLSIGSGQEQVGIELQSNTDNTKGFVVHMWGNTTENSQPIYIFEDVGHTDNVDETEYSYIPNSTATKLPANTHVLYPKNLSSGSVSKVDTTYDLLTLADLGWGDVAGNPIISGGNQDNSIKKMFNMRQKVEWSVAADLNSGIFGNIGADIGSKGSIVKTTIGSPPYEKQVYVPTGSIAFSINKVPAGGAKIRIIVKVPQSDVINGLGMNGDPKSADYFVGLWRAPEKNPNSFITIGSFNEKDAIQKVEMPRSQSFLNSSTDVVPSPFVQNGISSDNEYINVKYNNQNYTTMLQGGNYLMAYEFTVAEKGVYILATNKTSMQIAYCAADGIASAGLDGTGNAMMGNIDYVYDNSSNVVLVTDLQPDTQTTADTSKYFYESNIMIHFDNVTANANGASINYEKICIRRWLGSPPANAESGNPPSNSNLKVRVTSKDQYVLADKKSTVHDNLVLEYVQG